MAELGPISDETFGEAGALIRAVSGVGPRPEVEIRPGLEQMVAGAALSLSEGAPPSTFWDSRASRAEDYLTEGREEWRHFHAAVARVIDIERTQPREFETPGDVMGHIAGDVMTQARARRMALAIDNTDPAFSKYLSNASRDTVMYARQDPEIAELVHAEARGGYDRFDPASRSEIASNITNGEYVTFGIQEGIGIAETAIDRHLEALPSIERERDSRLADYQEFGSPLFPAASEAHWARASELAAGTRQPGSEVERGIVAHAALEEHDAMLRAADVKMGHVAPTLDMNADVEASERLAAYARAIARSEEPNALYVDAATHAGRIEADVVGMRRLQAAAMESMYQDLQTPQEMEVANQRGLLALAAGNIDKADPQVQMSAFAAIRDLDGVAPMRAIDLSFAAAAVERGELVVGVAREARDNEAKRVISYEGSNVGQLRDQDQRWRDDLYLPGDRVRVNDKVTVAGLDKVKLSLLGDEPLEIAKTVVRGDVRSNGMGGTYDAAFPEYEFKGVGERFPASQFQHERGDEHHYGAMMMKNEKLWFVPMSENLDKPEVTGAAREVTRTIGSVEGMKSLAEAKDFFRDDAASGEFVMRPEAFGQKAGPIELVAVPWMSGLNDAERGLAGKAIEQAERGDRPTIGAAVGAAMAGQGR